MSKHLEVHRREFVLGMSAFAISGLAHCENYSPKKETGNRPHPLAIPSYTVHIRVRVGRYRESQQATVNGGQVRVVEGELQTTTAIRFSPL